jgi:hypothetical protein
VLLTAGWRQRLDGDSPCLSSHDLPTVTWSGPRRRGRRPHHGNKGSLLLKALTETDKGDVDELPAIDGHAKFAKLVGDCLKTLPVDAEKESP